MKKYLFTEEDFKIIRILKSKIPKKIWFDVIQYIFDYGDSYIKLEVKSTTNPANYAIKKTYESTIGFSVVNETFTPNGLSMQLCENENITDIYIVRTLIYHSNYQKPDEQDKNKFMALFSSIRPENKDKFDAFINQIDGISSDFVVNPNSPLPNNVNPDTTNLVDVGLLICLKNKYIKTFVTNQFPG